MEDEFMTNQNSAKESRGDEVKVERQCIWMKAGVINMKLCPYNYACHLCAFDKALRTKGVQRPGGRYNISWQDKLRKLNGPERFCRHMLQGHVSFKVCPNDYNCGTCEYDQMILDRLGDAWEPELRKISGFTLSPTFHFHDRHIWVNVEYAGKCRVGFDDFASQVLGRDRELLLPSVGQVVRQNETFMKVRAANREFSVPSPMDGTVSVVNPIHRLARDLNPYSDGWVAFIEPGERMLPNLKKLKYGDDAMEWLGESADKLFQSLSPGRKTAADGGLIAPELMKTLAPEKRADLIENVVFGG